MARITIESFVESTTIAEHMWTLGHRVSYDDLYDVISEKYGEFFVVPNRADRAAEHLLLGKNRSGRCVASPIFPTDDETKWRPATAWFCKPAEAAQYTRLSRGK